MIVPRYLDRLVLASAGPGEWSLVKEFRFDSAVLRARVVIRPGFTTDLASVPRVPLAYWLVGGLAEAPAVLHDFAYTIQLCTRAQADALFLEAMETDGRHVGIPAVPAWRRRLLWAGVRLGGGWRW